MTISSLNLSICNTNDVANKANELVTRANDIGPHDNVNITGGTISGVTLSVTSLNAGTITVTSTLDVTAGTFSISDNAISGDKIDGGTISNATILLAAAASVGANPIRKTEFDAFANGISTLNTLAGLSTVGTSTITNSAVTYAKIQNISSNGLLLGRNTAGAGVVEELSAATVKTILSLNNVENTALSTWAGSGNITTLGTIGSGTWHGTALTSLYGGTGSTFTKFSGPASTEKTFTLPNASCSILTDNAAITVAQGGTGATTLTGVLKGNGTSAFTAATAGTDFVAPGTKTSFTKQQNFTAVALTSTSNSIAWDLDNAQAAKHTATENTTLANPTNQVSGGVYTFAWTQHASAAKTLAFGTAYKWAGGIAPVVTTAVNSKDILTFISDGTNMYGVAQLNFS